MTEQQVVSRRSVLLGAAAGAAGVSSAGGLLTGPTAAGSVAPAAAEKKVPLWRPAYDRGILYGAATATWQIGRQALQRAVQAARRHLVHAGRLPLVRAEAHPGLASSTSPSATRSSSIAERNKQLVFGAHLVWDEGFGEGWTDKDLWDIGEKRARKLLFGTLRKTVRRYRGRVHIWSVANEVIVNGPDDSKGGLRLDVPWIHTIGPEYVATAFHQAHEADPDACLILNDFGYETVNEFGDKPSTKRAATLKVLDRLLDQERPGPWRSASRHTYSRTSSRTGSTRRRTAVSSASSPTAGCRS